MGYNATDVNGSHAEHCSRKRRADLFASANELTGPTVVEKTQKWV